MWLGSYSWLSLLGILLQSTFIQNILLSNFLGMCSYLACSNNVKIANGLGFSVALVLTVGGTLNWFVHNFITKKGALTWLNFIGLDFSYMNLEFLELITFIAVIAAFVQILEILIEKFSQPLYLALGIFLPLIAVNCAILGGVLFGILKDYPLIPMVIFCLGAGSGWWLAIMILATIKEKLKYSTPPKGLGEAGLAFIVTGLIAMAFMGLTGINLDTSVSSNQIRTEELCQADIRDFLTPLTKPNTFNSPNSP